MSPRWLVPTRAIVILFGLRRAESGRVDLAAGVPARNRERERRRGTSETSSGSVDAEWATVTRQAITSRRASRCVNQ